MPRRDFVDCGNTCLSSGEKRRYSRSLDLGLSVLLLRYILVGAFRPKIIGRQAEFQKANTSETVAKEDTKRCTK